LARRFFCKNKTRVKKSITMLTTRSMLMPVLVVAWWYCAGTCLAFELQVQAASFRHLQYTRASRRIMARHVQSEMMDRRTVAARAGLLAGAALCGADPVLADATARRPPPAARLAGKLDQVRALSTQFSLDASSKYQAEPNLGPSPEPRPVAGRHPPCLASG